MIVLEPGINNLVQGVVYALPSYPAQILNDGVWIQYAPPNGILIGYHEIYYEPGIIVNGGQIKSTDANCNLVLKKHTIGSIPTSTSYESTILLDKPSYWWRLDEASGTNARERIQAANGTISGGVTVDQPGIAGKGMLFNGVDGRILVTQDLRLFAPFTFEAWVKPTSLTGYRMLCSSREGIPGNFAIYLETGGESLSINFSTSFFAAATIPITINQWHHIVVNFNSTTLKIFVDGQSSTHNLAEPFPTFSGTDQSAFSIGSDYAGGFWWNGSIDEVAIYPYALSPEQIKSHFLAKSGLVP